jgi:hypothetical protein
MDEQLRRRITVAEELWLQNEFRRNTDFIGLPLLVNLVFVGGVISCGTINTQKFAKSLTSVFQYVQSIGFNFQAILDFRNPVSAFGTMFIFVSLIFGFDH